MFFGLFVFLVCLLDEMGSIDCVVFVRIFDSGLGIGCVMK